MLGIFKVFQRVTLAVPYLYLFTLKLQSWNEKASNNLERTNGNYLEANGLFLSLHP